MDKTPGETLGITGPVCCCGPDRTVLPPTPLENHSFGCLVWDAAVATKQITPAQRMEQLDVYDKEIDAFKKKPDRKTRG
jgi:hypothetical protein